MKFIAMLFMMLIFLGVIFSMNYSILSIFMTKKKVISLVCLGIIIFVLTVMFLSNLISNPILTYFKELAHFYIGTMFIFFVLSLIFRLINLFVKLDSKYLAITLLITGVIIVIFAIFNSIGFETKEYLITSNNLNKDYNLIHISDIHIGSNSKNHLINVVNHINKLKNIDAVFITGDLVDENIEFDDLEVINDLKVKTYFVYGNHEYFIDQKRLKKIFEKLNMTILEDTSTILDGLQIMGVNDNSNLNEELNKIKINKNKFSILLNHQPKYIDFAKSKNVNLMLAGHTHAGQIWPFSLLVRLQFKYIGGFYDLDNFYLNVNPGTGTWGPKMRLGSKNEISVIKLRK